ncbi:hypothetical protein Tsubulata_014743, partial [Turnera subulata]
LFNMETDDQSNATTCFLRWMVQQEKDLTELHEAMNAADGSESRHAHNDPALRQLAEKVVKHFESYMEERMEIASRDVSIYFAPTWHSSLSNSLLWVGGCRPTIFIRLLYAACASEAESQLSQYLAGSSSRDTLGGLSSRQLNQVNELHCKTIKEEEKLTSQLASLQEEMADEPISEITRVRTLGCPMGYEDVREVFQNHDKAMAGILREAEMLRLNTLKELLQILTPRQGQEKDLAELNQAMEAAEGSDDDHALRQLTEKVFKHFESYMEERMEIASRDVSIYFAPTWHSSLSNSLLWIGGCRPTIFIRLIYAACASEAETLLSQYLAGGSSRDTLGGLSARQLNLVNELHCKTLKHEEKLTSLLASLQEEMADEPIYQIAKDRTLGCPMGYEEVREVFQNHDRAMAGILREAELLRLNTLKELLEILTPRQGVELLAAGKKLHFCLHQWGKERDQLNGRGHQLVVQEDGGANQY